VNVAVEGVVALLFHKYDCAEVEAKSAAKKGSATKKTDNIESFLYREPTTGALCLPAQNIKACLVEAGRSIPDPRSPRKSARDLLRAAILVEPEYVVFDKGPKTWDYLDKRGAVIQRNRITRVRPALNAGWRLSWTIHVTQPTYITPLLVEEVVKAAGAFNGLGDFRPDYGRFAIRSFEIA